MSDHHRQALKPDWKPIPRADAPRWGLREEQGAAGMRMVGLHTDHGRIDLPTVPPSRRYFPDNDARAQYYPRWVSGASHWMENNFLWHVMGDVRIRLSFNRGKTTADLDNLSKAVLDALSHAGRIADDRRVIELRLQWSKIVRGTRIEIWAAHLNIGD